MMFAENECKEKCLRRLKGLSVWSMTNCNALVHTLVGAAPCLITDHERIVLIEDTAEIQIQKESALRFEVRREQNGLSAVATPPPRFFVSPDESEEYLQGGGDRKQERKEFQG